MFGFKVIFVISAIFTFCESAAITDNIEKCALADGECQRTLYRNFLTQVSDSGIPEMGIPAIDPFVIKDMEITALSLLKIKMPEGVAKGFKNCVSNSYTMDTEKLVASIEMVCEQFSIDGQYIIETTPVLEALIGGIKVHGEGKATIEVGKIQLNLEIPFEIKKLEDGEIHIVLDADTITYTHKMLEKVTFAADNLNIGSQEISAVVVNIFNENWEFISNSFAKPIIDKALEVFVEYGNKFLAEVPAKDLLSDDLSAHVTL